MAGVPLSQRYPYIYAWCRDLGSYDYYPKQEAEAAAADGVPEDVIYRRDWDEIDSHGRQEDALEMEQAGAAVVLRKNGEPWRVWYRIGSCTIQLNKDRVTRMAERIKAGQSPFTS